MSKNEIHDGSLKTLWKVSSALMISFLSMVAMMFCDRLFLSYYSADALSAASSAGTLFFAGNFGWVTLAAMAEVFVAQYNGSKQYKRLGEPVYQMVYLSIVAAVFFISLGTVGTDFLMQSGFLNPSEGEYFRWNNLFAPFLTLLTAIGAFFIGQGKTRIITYLALLGNGVNVILDPLFIFGYKGIIPSMGIKGAAIATGMGFLVQVVIIGTLFLSKKNREEFGTNDYRFKLPSFIGCIKVGAPPALFVLCECLGWGLFYKMMATISTKHILVASVTQSVLFLFLFFGLGLEKGGAAVAGNLIGAKKFEEVKRVFTSGVKLTLLFSLVLALFLGSFPDFFTNLFFKNPEALTGSTLGVTPTLLQEVKVSLRGAMFMLIVYLTLENVRWMLSGLLTASGDTFYLMVAGATSIWVFMLIPTYFFVMKPKAPIEAAFVIWIAYSIISAGLLYYRFRKEKWREKHLYTS